MGSHFSDSHVAFQALLQDHERIKEQRERRERERKEKEERRFAELQVR